MEEGTIKSEADVAVKLFETLKTLTPEKDDLSHRDEVDDQFGRFNIVTRNIGIFAFGHASLDHRLRQSDDAREVTLRLLRSLQWFLRRAIQAFEVSSANLGSSTQLGLSKCVSDDTSSASTISYLSSETSGASTEDTLETNDVTSAVEQLSGIEETIDRLYRLSWIIRTPISAAQNAKAASFLMIDDDGKDYELTFEEYAARVVQSRCPATSRELIQKLAKSITIRRKRFLYRRSHQAKLDSRSPDAQATGVTRGVQRPTTSATIRNASQGPHSRATPSSSHQISNFKGIAPSATSASKFSHTRFLQDAVFGTRSTVSTVLYSPNDVDDAFQPPPPPNIAKGSKEFECPYCYVLIPIKEAKSAQWKQHFLKDLDPFVCLFPECPDTELMFPSVDEWMRHMEICHTRQWCCNSKGHNDEFFSTDSEFEKHMWSCHPGTFAENHLPMLKQRAEVPGTAFTECPFCLSRPEASMDSGIGLNELVTHVANHLHSIALISLPPEDTFGNMKSDITASDRANESTKLDGGLLEEVESLPSQSDSTYSDYISLEHVTNLTLRAEESEAEVKRTGLPFEDEWDFIEPKDYQGHDRDPVLQTFLRKLYLESSPSMSNMKGPSLPCFFVPFERNPNFFGREHALSKAAESLTSTIIASNPSLPEPLNNPKTFAIYGPGGMGKTQTAVEFVHRYRDEFDVVLWAHADDASKLAQDFNVMAIKLGLVAEHSMDAKSQIYTRELVKRWLVDPLKDLKNESSERASWLLIYDAVEDSRIINDFWPYDGPGSILITSRSPFSWTASLPLLPFSVNEATDYLLKLTRRDNDAEGRANAQDVSVKLGGLPLALTQMAGIITRQDMTFAEFAKAYNERESRRQMLQTAPASAFSVPWYEHSVASVWALETLQHGQTLLNICSMLDPDCISERIFTENLGKCNLPGFPDKLTDYQQARAELLGSSILSSEKGSGSFFLHRLVQDVARMRLNPTQFRHTFMACVHLISKLWQFEDFTWRHGVGRWSVCQELFPHVLRLRELALQHRLFPSAEDLDGDYAFARLLTDAGWYHHERGRSAEARWFNDIVEHICQAWVKRLQAQQPPPSNSQVKLQRLDANLAEIIHNRGCIVTETNQPQEAIKYFEHFNMKMTKEFEATPELVKRDMRFAISWNELGNAHMLNRQWKKGEECFQRSIETMGYLENFQKSHISLPKVNLGLAYWLQNMLLKAQEILTEGLKERQDAFGLDDRISFITGRYLHALGNVMASIGDRQQSFDYHRKALFHYKSTLGNSHHRTADLFVKLAEHSMGMEQEENALALLDHALKTYSNHNTGERDTYKPEKARSMFKRSQVFRIMRKVEEADEELEAAALLRREVVGPVEGSRDPKSLTDDDFDDLIAFWSR